MKLSLNFEFGSSEEAEAFLRTVRERAAVIDSPPAAAAQESEAPPLLPTHKTPAKSRKGKSKPELVEVQETIPAPMLEPATVTLEDVQKKVQAVFEAKGMHHASGLLSRFGAKRVRDLLPTAYADLVAHADKILAGAPA